MPGLELEGGTRRVGSTLGLEEDLATISSLSTPDTPALKGAVVNSLDLSPEAMSQSPTSFRWSGEEVSGSLNTSLEVSSPAEDPPMYRHMCVRAIHDLIKIFSGPILF